MVLVHDVIESYVQGLREESIPDFLEDHIWPDFQLRIRGTHRHICQLPPSPSLRLRYRFTTFTETVIEKPEGNEPTENPGPPGDKPKELETTAAGADKEVHEENEPETKIEEHEDIVEELKKEEQNPAVAAEEENKPGSNAVTGGVPATPEAEAVEKEEEIEGEPTGPEEKHETEQDHITEAEVNNESASASEREQIYLASGTPAEDFWRKPMFRELAMEILEPGIKGVTPENYDLWHAIHPRYMDSALIYARHARWAQSQTLAALRGAAKDAHAAQEAAVRANAAALQALRRPTSTNFPQMVPPKLPFSPWPVEMPSSASKGPAGKLLGWMRADPSRLGPLKPPRPPEPEKDCDKVLLVKERSGKPNPKIIKARGGPDRVELVNNQYMCIEGFCAKPKKGNKKFLVCIDPNEKPPPDPERVGSGVEETQEQLFERLLKWFKDHPPHDDKMERAGNELDGHPMDVDWVRNRGMGRKKKARKAYLKRHGYPWRIAIKQACPEELPKKKCNGRLGCEFKDGKCKKAPKKETKEDKKAKQAMMPEAVLTTVFASFLECPFDRQRRAHVDFLFGKPESDF